MPKESKPSRPTTPPSPALELYKRDYANVQSTFDSVHNYIWKGFELGNTYFQKGDLMHARESYLIALKVVDPLIEFNKSSIPSSFQLLRLYYAKGTILTGLSDTEIDSQNRLLEKSGQQAIDALTIALTGFQKLLTSPEINLQAETALQKYIEGARLNLGKGYMARGQGHKLNHENKEALTDYEKAKECYEQQLKINPKNIMLMVNLGATEGAIGQIHRIMKNYSPAKAALHNATTILENVLRIAPREVFIWENKAVAHSDLGFLEAASGDASAALKDRKSAFDAFSKAIEIEPRTPRHYFRRGEMSIYIHKPGAAANDFATCVNLAPNRLDYRIRYAQTLMMLGRLNEALQQYVIIDQKLPRDANLRGQATEVVKRIGDRDESIKINKKDVEKARAELKRVLEDEMLKNLHTPATEDDLFYVLRHELYWEYTGQRNTATDPKRYPPPPTMAHRFAYLINLGGGALISGGPAGTAGSLLLDRATNLATGKVDAWNAAKSLRVKQAFRNATVAEGPGIMDDVSEAITKEYGKTIERLRLNPLGLIAFVGTLVENLYRGIGNDPKLVDDIEKGRITLFDACMKKLKQGNSSHIIWAGPDYLVPHNTTDVLKKKFHS